MTEKNSMKDLGLSYEEAAHGVQSAIRFEMSRKGLPDEGLAIDMLKHLRTGIDCRAADALGLAELLIAKGIITKEEYVENMRLAMNAELDRYEEHVSSTYGLGSRLSFR